MQTVIRRTTKEQEAIKDNLISTVFALVKF